MKFAFNIPALHTSIVIGGKFSCTYLKAVVMHSSLLRSQWRPWIFPRPVTCLFKSWNRGNPCYSVELCLCRSLMIKLFDSPFLILFSFTHKYAFYSIPRMCTSINSDRRANPTTVIPLLAKRTAICAPIPADAPVTSATCCTHSAATDISSSVKIIRQSGRLLRCSLASAFIQLSTDKWRCRSLSTSNTDWLLWRTNLSFSLSSRLSNGSTHTKIITHKWCIVTNYLIMAAEKWRMIQMISIFNTVLS